MPPITRRLVAPVLLPLTLVQAKAHLKVAGSTEDDYLLALIDAAASAFEVESKTALMQGTYLSMFAAFGYRGSLDGLLTPVGTVTEVAYTAADATDVVLPGGAYTISPYAPGMLVAGVGYTAPARTAYARPDAVRVAYTAGYSDPALVPGLVRQWLLLTLAHWYENRQTVQGESRASLVEVPQTAKYLMNLIREPTL